MHRGLARLLLAFVTLTCPGCTTALLWNWAGEEEVPGQLVGVVSDVRGDVVLYEFDETEEYRSGPVGVRIAPGWRGLPLTTLATTPFGDALALATPFVPAENISLAVVASPRPLLLVDYRNTVGRQVVLRGPEATPYGYVELMNERGEVVHELYGFHDVRGQWVRLASVNLGAFRASSGRVSAGVVLTPVTLVLDLAIFTAIAWALSGGGTSVDTNVQCLDFASWDSGRPQIVRFAARTLYWQSLAAPAGPLLR